MKYLFILIALILIPNSSYADDEKCSLKDVGLGREFSEISKQYNLHNDLRNDRKYTKNIRGKDICKALGNAEVSLIFVSNKLVQIEIYDRSSQRKILNLAINNFGTPLKMPADDSGKSFSTMWDKEDFVLVYSTFNVKGNNAERLVIQNKNSADDLAHANSFNENGSNEEDLQPEE